MFSKINSKWLAGIFGVLLVFAVAITLINKSDSTSSKNRTFKSELAVFDSSEVNRITIHPRFEGNPVELVKKGDRWKVMIDNKEYNADKMTVKGMLTSLLDMRATRIATKNRDQWEKYEVTDSLATRIIVSTAKKAVADIYLGKFSYQQPKNNDPYSMYGQQRGTMTSYVRPKKEKEVYAVDGMISMSFNRRANDFRDRNLIRSDVAKWNRVSVTSPEGIYALDRQGDHWMIDGFMTDSTTTAKYLTTLSRLSSGDFLDESAKRSDLPVNELTIEGENMNAPIKIRAFAADTTDGYVMTSSLNEGSYFSGKKAGLFEKVFKPKEFFFPAPEVNAVKK